MMDEPNFILPPDQGFKGKLLDIYLAFGYYRMQHLVFTTHHTQLGLGSSAVPVFWLRVLILKLKEQKSASVIRKKCAAFKVTYKKAEVNAEVEELYQRYRNHVDFSTAITCADYLHQPELSNPFDSWMVEIRQQELLVAVGFFDKGEKTMAGILNFYNPDFNHYSLGKYLILKKIDFAVLNNIQLYYTGYISSVSNKFDYKLFPCSEAVEVYLPIENDWQPFNNWGKEKLHQYFIDNFTNLTT